MKKVTLFIFAIFVGLWTFYPLSVAAHTLKVDGSFGVVLHVSPDHEPAAGETATIYFEIKNKQEKFVPGGCDCVAVIRQGELEVARLPLFISSENPSVDYVFPHRGVFQIELEGKPKAGFDFQVFKVSYDQRIEKGEAVPSGEDVSGHDTHSDGGEWWLWVGLFVLLLFTAVVGLRKYGIGKRNSARKNVSGLMVLLILTVALFLQQTALVHASCHTDDGGHAMVHKQCKVTPSFDAPAGLSVVNVFERIEKVAIETECLLFLETALRLSGRSPPHS